MFRRLSSPAGIVPLPVLQSSPIHWGCSSNLTSLIPISFYRRWRKLSSPSSEQELFALLPNHHSHRWNSNISTIAAEVVDPRRKHIQKLVSAGFEPEKATSLLHILERLAEVKAKEIKKSYLTKDEYDSILKAYNSGIDRFFIENQSVQKHSDESVQEGYANLIQRSSALNASIIEEIKNYESGIQLDINLEKKKQQEFVSKLDDQASDIEKYMKSSIENVRQKLTGLEQNGKYAIFGKPSN